MKSIPITHFRAHLSRYLDAVRGGQSIEIRDRNVPVARLVPITAATPSEAGTIPPWVERLRRSGGARIGTLKPLPRNLRRLPAGAKTFGVVDALIDERRNDR